MKKILIVGGGASGVLVAINIARLTKESISMTIAEPREFLGQGVAYSTEDLGHLLNVPAGRMSALVDQPEHFCNWGSFDSNYFAPRFEYGRYLLETLTTMSKENSDIAIEHLKDSVVEVSHIEDGFLAIFLKSESRKFDVVVLAIGQGEAIQHQALEALASNPNVINDAWRDCIPEFEGVLACVGTGLTFIDHALSHLRKNPQNSVFGISRNGLVPEPHLPKRAAPLTVPIEARKSPQAMKSFIEESSDWRAAQDGVRHELPDIWFSWQDDMKSEFLNNSLRWWNVRRHRVSPEIHMEFEAALSQGRITIIKDEVELLKDDSDSLLLKTSGGASITANVVVSCLGYGTNYDQNLVKGLLASGLASPGPLGLGISTFYPEHSVINHEGKIVENLFALGSILLGERFETTAIPEIRIQAQAIAKAII